MDGCERPGVWAEQSVIGCMLTDPRAVGRVVARMNEADFTMEVNRILFRVFRDLFSQRKAIDPVLVHTAAAPNDDGLRRYMLELMDITPAACSLDDYMEEAQRTSRMVRGREIGAELQNAATEEDFVQLLARGQEIFSDHGREDEWNMDKAMLRLMDFLSTPADRLPWGFPELDRNLTVSKGQLVVLGGRPSDGKTALALHMAYEQSKCKRVCFFTLEDDEVTISMRLVSSVSGVPMERMLSRALNERDHILIADAVEEIRERDLIFVESHGWTVAEIMARAQYHRCEVLYIDYLQLVRSDVKGRPTRYEEVSDISRKLATEARRSKITVVALAQLSRPPMKGDRSSPYMADLKESGQIEQDANVIMFIWRRDETKSNTKRYLTIAKNKLGKLARWKIKYDGVTQRFSPDLVVESDAEYENPLEDKQGRNGDPAYQQTFVELPDGSTKTPWG